MDLNKQLVGHESCPSCGSRDNLGRYADGHAYCFGCGYKEPPSSNNNNGASEMNTHFGKPKKTLLEGASYDIPARMLNKDTCQAWGYTVAKNEQNQPVQVANHFDDAGNIVAQKIRDKDKNFEIRGDKDKMHLYGMHMWRPGGKLLVITEGEIDALSFYQMTAGKVAVVSVPNGAQTALKSIQKDLEFVESFERVVLLFDNDEPGRKATMEVAQVLSPGKAQLVNLPEKDANDCLTKGKMQQMLDAFSQARPYRPDGVIAGSSLKERVLTRPVRSNVHYPWAPLDDMLMGIREGELIVVTAGIGTGKTTFVTEMAYQLAMEHQANVGMLMMEDMLEGTAWRLMGHYLNRAIHIDQEGVTPADMEEAFEKVLGDDRFYLYDHQGEADGEAFLSKVNYFINGLGCKYLFIDNLSVVVAGLEERDERRMIDKMMKKLWSIASRNRATIFLVSHMKRIDGNKGHEDGATTSMSHLRGSNSIGSNANAVIGLERNQQGENPNLVTVRVLKNRHCGTTGIACQLLYDKRTGRLDIQEQETFEVGF